ncbi:G-type lectin S-receptor-like serine/threonine-protein kinase [Tanacetum coccineum]|uniref:G-type lectin S-receptor-like serine/threonine-protein kinase n=1 Tax=Tanacetum coccineum TaxID=301880 RepID=A0ABQ4XXW5_9ASTR
MSVLKRLESIRGRFFNGHDINSKKTSWVKWKNVLASKEKGGLGVSSLYALNRGLMFKWVWRFYTQNNSLWAKVIKAIHGDDGKVGKKTKSVFPSIWIDIVHEMESLKNQDIDILKSHPCLDHSFRRAPRSGVEQEQFIELINQVQSVSLVPCRDRRVWSLEGSGEFSVASVRKLIDDKILPEVSSKTRWVKAIPIKVNVHAWKVRLDYLPTRFNISRRGMVINSISCPICDNGVESTSHLFFSCQIVKDIVRWWDISFMELSSYEEWVVWLSNLHLSIAIILTVFVVVIGLVIRICMHTNASNRRSNRQTQTFNNDSRFIPISMVKFLNDMEREKPIRFTSQQLRIATDFTIELGSGAFGTVYKGIFTNGTPVAVKVLNGTSDKRIEEQFMAEVSTMGRTHHFNLVRLYGFCFESTLRALVYEFMINGSLDNILFKANKGAILEFEKLQEIALGTARGIAYLHEECPQRIIHYDIKPGNILLDSDFCAKVADFGLAKLCNRDNTHITMTGGRGTPGYAAPELWMPLPVTHKCDVYSFGMLLFEIIGRRRNMDVTLGGSEQWFPIWACDKSEKKQLYDLFIACEIEEKDQEIVERMLKVALCCVQQRAETRPVMSLVVKMLEGGLEVPEPPNPFTHLFSGVREETLWLV